MGAVLLAIIRACCRACCSITAPADRRLQPRHVCTGTGGLLHCLLVCSASCQICINAGTRCVFLHSSQVAVTATLLSGGVKHG